MKQYLLPGLAALVLSLSFGVVSPMLVAFSGKTGRVIDKTVETPIQVNMREAQYLNHINDLDRMSANVMVLQNPDIKGNIVVYLTW